MYSPQLLDHFQNPRNTGDLSNADAVAELENPVCGDVIRLSLKMQAQRIEKIRFKAKGCVPAIACGSALTEMVLDKTVNEQIGSLSNKLRGDRTLENAARKQWTQMCRSISLGQASAGAPHLWLEVKPTRAFAAQPKILTDWVILTLGVQAETRIVPSETNF